MIPRIIPWQLAVLVLIFPAVTVAQSTFSTLRSVHFDVRYQQGVPEAEAQRVLQLLQSEYDTLKSQLGLDVRAKLEVRLYDSPGKFRSEINMGREVLPAMYVRGMLHALVSTPPEGLDNALRYQLARVFLEQSVQRSCPSWLREAFAVYHSGRMPDLSAPGAVAISSFSDLSQDLQEATTPAERKDVDFVLGRTMQFFVEKFGEKKTFGVFKEFDGTSPTEKVFKKVFGEEFHNIEQAWAKYVSLKPRRPK